MTRSTGLIGLAIFLLLISVTAAARQIDVPLQIEYRHIRDTLIKQLYTGAGQTATIWSDGGGCSSIIFSDPRVGSRHGFLHLVNTAKVRLGALADDGCVSVLEWDGKVETYHKPQLERDEPLVKFPIIDANALQSDGTPFTSGPVWDSIKRHTKPRLAPMRVDLQTAVNQLRKLLPLVVAEKEGEPIERMLDSLAFKTINAHENYLQLQLGFEVKDVGATYRDEPTLTSRETKRWDTVWRHWDAFVTHSIKQIAEDTDSKDLRDALMGILLQARYHLKLGLTTSSEKPNDPVRALFVKTWNRLAPVLRKVSQELPDELPINYLTFIAAGDALRALDQMGPAVGMEISADGLRRLARILAPEYGGDPLEYNQEIDPSLRKLFGFQPAKPAFNPERPANKPYSLFRAAHAGPPVSETALAKRLHWWVPSRAEISEYLRLVHMLLVQTAHERSKTGKLESQFNTLFRNMLLATAWQESCWRQFIVKANKIKVLNSATGDVGLMQINARVWRGFYDTTRLNNEITYNAWAGSEILMHYLGDYAIKKKSIAGPATRTTWRGQPILFITAVLST